MVRFIVYFLVDVLPPAAVLFDSLSGSEASKGDAGKPSLFLRFAPSGLLPQAYLTLTDSLIRSFQTITLFP